MGRTTIEVKPGDIFTIPLFLPSYQEWTKMDDYLDYRKYRFCLDDIYVFGRLIEIQTGHMDLVEVFSYAGEIPKNPKEILDSGRMFEPVHIGHSLFEKGRWRVIFSDPAYDMWKDSDYGNISFLSPVGHMWKGKETIKITKKEYMELKDAGVPDWIAYGGIPRPSDLDKKLKEMIAPFCWQSEQGRYTLSLDAGLLNGDCFMKNHMLGNGYDCEADTFSMTCSSKKMLKEFSISFHKLVMDTSDFEEFLRKVDKAYSTVT